MYIDIVSPETTLFSGEIQSITVPGTKGSFQILNQHAPIVSTLTKGKVKIQGELNLSEEVGEKIVLENDGHYYFPINSGVIEMRNNKIVLLAE
jgi:F-type H+-transporting ATPase subunit epsilon|tara:strand:- start:317 stop:595 length:279 start_codon:yes stop_codon:yes gene_type:complete